MELSTIQMLLPLSKWKISHFTTILVLYSESDSVFKMTILYLRSKYIQWIGVCGRFADFCSDFRISSAIKSFGMTMTVQVFRIYTLRETWIIVDLIWRKIPCIKRSVNKRSQIFRLLVAQGQCKLILDLLTSHNTYAYIFVILYEIHST